MYRHSRTRSGLWQAETEIETPVPRGARAFMPTFGAPFQGAFANPSVAAKWWLSGGIAAANCIAAYQPKGAASLAASYTNLANPGTYNAAPGTAPTWDAVNGWKFAGASSQYLTTGIVPAAGHTVIVQFSTLTGIGYLWGSYNGSDTRFYELAGTTYERHGYGSGYATATAVRLSGNIAIAGATAYYNGVLDANIGTTWSGVGAALYIGGRNNGGLELPVSAYVQAWAEYNTIITAPQITALTAAMALL